MSLLVIFEILGLFVNTLTVIGKHSLPHTDSLLRIIQMYLSMKQKVFSQSLAAFGKSKSYFKHFEKEDDPRSSCISDITDCERRG